ncbi:MAG: permease [Firmicutes bacterium]|nr:permease [Bacillota bacterium]
MFELNNLTATGEYFLLITGELLGLFVGVSFLIAALQEFIPEETLRRFLKRPSKWLGNILGAFFGAITPFCSCSTIPILVGLLNAGAPFGASMSFLIASPLLNPVILGLFLMLLGWKVMMAYAVITFIAAVLVGAIWESMGLASDYKAGVLQSGCGCNCSGVLETIELLTWQEKMKRAWGQTWILFRQVFPYLLVGAGVGAFIYGFIPEEFIIRVAGPNNPWAIPVAAAVGVPMYIRVETVLPISSVLLDKGMSLGALMALVIGGAGASIPEITLLASIFKLRLVSIFVITILGIAIIAGYLFQALQATLL